MRRPFGVIGFDADKRDVDRALLAELLHFGEVNCIDLHHMRFFRRHARQVQAVFAHGLDMFGPGIDQRDVMPGTGQMTAGDTTNGAGPDHDNTFTHNK